MCGTDSRLNVGTGAGTRLNPVTPDIKELWGRTASLLTALTEAVKAPPPQNMFTRDGLIIFSCINLFFFFFTYSMLLFISVC